MKYLDNLIRLFKPTPPAPVNVEISLADPYRLFGKGKLTPYNPDVLVRTKGSHHQFRHPVRAGLVTVPHPRRDLPIAPFVTAKMIAASEMMIAMPTKSSTRVKPPRRRPDSVCFMG